MATLLNEMLDNTKEYDFVHRSGFSELPSDVKDAIVIVHGEHEWQRWKEIESDLQKLTWALLIIICDEAPLFPWRKLVHPKRKIWIQTPSPTYHQAADRYMICGYPHDAQMHLSDYDAFSVDRPLDWFFAGQVTHGRRTQCVEQLRKMPNGLLFETPGFWQGLPRPEYYQSLSRARIVPCPSGPATPDSMRVAEALEAGCVPLVDGTCSRQNYPSGYWNFVLKSAPPFRIVDNWSELPRIMAEELAKWPNNRNELMVWWKEYKRSMSDWLREDLEYLRR